MILNSNYRHKVFSGVESLADKMNKSTQEVSRTIRDFVQNEMEISNTEFTVLKMDVSDKLCNFREQCKIFEMNIQQVVNSIAGQLKEDKVILIGRTYFHDEDFFKVLAIDQLNVYGIVHSEKHDQTVVDFIPISKFWDTEWELVESECKFEQLLSNG